MTYLFKPQQENRGKIKSLLDQRHIGSYLLLKWCCCWFGWF